MNDLDYVLDKFYNKDILVELFDRYFRVWIQKALIKTNMSAEVDMPAVRKAKKADLLAILKQFYTDAKTFQDIYQILPSDVQKAMFEIAWYGSVDGPSFEKSIGRQIIVRGRNYFYGSEEFRFLHPEFWFFRYRNESWHYDEGTVKGTLYLPRELCEILQQVLPKPVSATVQPITDIQTSFVHSAQKEILEEIELYCTYVKEGNVTINERTLQIATASIRSMQQYCHINEFFQDKDLAFLKTELLAKILIFRKLQAKQLDVVGSPADMVKDITLDFLEHSDEWPLLKMLLPHLKRSGYYYEKEQPVGKNVRKLILACLKYDSWVSFQNLSDFAFFNRIPFDLIHPQAAANYLYVTKAGRYGPDRVFLRGKLYLDYVRTPLLKGFFFLLAALGVVEIGYGMPPKGEITHGKKPYMTPYDGLQYVRLTDLGRYVMGLEQAFTVDVPRYTATVHLDEALLLATVAGEDKLVTLALEKIGERLQENVYQVSFASLFRECKTKNDIERKIALFQGKIHTDLPANWQTFFQQAISQSNSLTEQEDVVVFQLRKDPKLLALLAQDPALKMFVHKAEGYKILVESWAVPRVFELLREKGYFQEK